MFSLKQWQKLSLLFGALLTSVCWAKIDLNCPAIIVSLGSNSTAYSREVVGGTAETEQAQRLLDLGEMDSDSAIELPGGSQLQGPGTQSLGMKKSWLLSKLATYLEGFIELYHGESALEIVRSVSPTDPNLPDENTPFGTEFRYPQVESTNDAFAKNFRHYLDLFRKVQGILGLGEQKDLNETFELLGKLAEHIEKGRGRDLVVPAVSYGLEAIERRGGFENTTERFATRQPASAVSKSIKASAGGSRDFEGFRYTVEKLNEVPKFFDPNGFLNAHQLNLELPLPYPETGNPALSINACYLALVVGDTIAEILVQSDFWPFASDQALLDKRPPIQMTLVIDTYADHYTGKQFDLAKSSVLNLIQSDQLKPTDRLTLVASSGEGQSVTLVESGPFDEDWRIKARAAIGQLELIQGSSGYQTALTQAVQTSFQNKGELGGAGVVFISGFQKDANAKDLRSVSQVASQNEMRVALVNVSAEDPPWLNDWANSAGNVSRYSMPTAELAKKIAPQLPLALIPYVTNVSLRYQLDSKSDPKVQGLIPDTVWGLIPPNVSGQSAHIAISDFMLVRTSEAVGGGAMLVLFRRP